MDKYEVHVRNVAEYLGCILRDQSLMDESIVNARQLVDIRNKNIYKAMQGLHKAGIEVSIFSLMQLGESKINSFGGIDYLSDLMNTVTSIHSFKKIQEQIINFDIITQAQNEASSFLNATNEIHDIKELSVLIKHLSELEGKTVSKHKPFKQLLAERVQEHYSSPKEGLSGVETGFNNLNRLTDGWQNSELIILAARPSVGKTAFLLNSLKNGLKKDPNLFATFFSIEMAEGQIIDRLFALEGNIPVERLRNPNKTFKENQELWDAHSRAMGNLEKMNMDIRKDSTIPEIRAAVRQNMKDYPDKKHVIALDFLTLIKHVNPTGNRQQDVSDIVKDLKSIAKEFNVPFIVISQLNRAVEARQDKTPNMSDLNESGTIEQVADVIALLYREDYYDKGEQKHDINEVQMNIAKNRQGRTGVIKFKMFKETNVFRETF